MHTTCGSGSFWYIGVLLGKEQTPKSDNQGSQIKFMSTLNSQDHCTLWEITTWLKRPDISRNALKLLCLETLYS